MAWRFGPLGLSCKCHRGWRALSPCCPPSPGPQGLQRGPLLSRAVCVLSSPCLFCEKFVDVIALCRELALGCMDLLLSSPLPRGLRVLPGRLPRGPPRTARAELRTVGGFGTHRVLLGQDSDACGKRAAAGASTSTVPRALPPEPAPVHTGQAGSWAQRGPRGS